MCSYQSKNFEREECMKCRIDYEVFLNESAEVTEIHCSKTTSEPRKNIERFRLYEFLVKAFDDKNNNDEFDDYYVEKCIKSLDTFLDVNGVNKDYNKDHFASCIDSIFDASNINNADDENESIENLLDDNYDEMARRMMNTI